MFGILTTLAHAKPQVFARFRGREIENFLDLEVLDP